VRKPETCWAVHMSKRQVINLRSCCIWLVNLFETVPFPYHIIIHSHQLPDWINCMHMRTSKKFYATKGNYHMLIEINEFICKDCHCFWFCVLYWISSVSVPSMVSWAPFPSSFILDGMCSASTSTHFICKTFISLSCSSCEVSHIKTVIKERGIICLFSCLHWLYWKWKKCMWNVSKFCFVRVGKIGSQPTYYIRI